MSPFEFAMAMERNELFYDSVSGKIVSVFTRPDIEGNLTAHTEDGEFIKVNARNLSIAGKEETQGYTNKPIEQEGRSR